MKQPTIVTGECGVLQLDPRTNWYEGAVKEPFEDSVRVAIAADDIDSGLPRVQQFISWFKVNYEAFKKPLEHSIQDYDLVWDNVWDDILGADWVDQPVGFLADYLNYRSVDYCDGKLYLWVDTSGLHTDHMVRVTLSQSMDIDCCEML